MSEYTICGHCNERVKVRGLVLAKHGCKIVQSLKKSFNEALRAIQHETDRQLAKLHLLLTKQDVKIGTFTTVINGRDEHFRQRIDTLEKHGQSLYDLNKKQDASIAKSLVDIYKIKERLSPIESTFVTLDQFGAWRQRTTEIDHRVSKLLKELELLKHPAKKTIADLNAKDGSEPCVKEYVETQGNNIRVIYKFADGRLDTIEKQDVHHPSRQHLEKTLAAKNQRIKELEYQLGQRNNECQAALNDLGNAKNAYDSLLKSWQSLNRTVLELKIAEDKFKSSPYGGGGGCYI